MKASEMFAQTVKNRINGDKNHGWGVDDSVEVIMAVVATETGTEVKDIESIRGLIKAVVNPSAFRQQLETKELLNKSVGKAKNKGISSLLDGIA